MPLGLMKLRLTSLGLTLTSLEQLQLGSGQFELPFPARIVLPCAGPGQAPAGTHRTDAEQVGQDQGGCRDQDR